jgi:hypothetical protein
MCRSRLCRLCAGPLICRTAYALSRVCTEAAYVLGRLCVWTPLYAVRLIAGRLCADRLCAEPLMRRAAYMPGRLCTEPLMYRAAYVRAAYVLLSPYGLSALLLSSLCVLGALCAEPLMYCAACAEPLMC